MRPATLVSGTLAEKNLLNFSEKSSDAITRGASLPAATSSAGASWVCSVAVSVVCVSVPVVSVGAAWFPQAEAESCVD